MKKLITFLVCAVSLFSFSYAQQQPIAAAKAGVQYGAKVVKNKAISVAQLEKKLSSTSSFEGQIEGEVVQVCKKKGCFITLKRKDGEPIMVRFTDYAYFLPQDIVGKTVVLAGKAKQKETSVEWQKHYAEDKGLSKEEIAKINSVKKDISIVADGVLVL